jgi:hypothetical protein
MEELNGREGNADVIIREKGRDGSGYVMEVCDECFRISGIRDSRVWSVRVLCIWDPRYPDVR